MSTVQQPAAHRSSSTAGLPAGRAYLFPIVAALTVLAFLAAPWSFEHKAHAALHGLCAQRPSHSLTFGDRTLPLDARMTGIYGGFLCSAFYLALRGRARAAALPSIPTMAILALFVAAMAVDGFNSLFFDLGWNNPYQPDNRLRLLTGAMTGVALASAVFVLIGMAVWRRPIQRPRVVSGPREPFVMLALSGGFALLAASGVDWLYAPVTLALLLSALAVVTTIMTVVIVLARTADNSFDSLAQVQGYAVAGLFTALLVMGAFGGGRHLLESLTNAPPLV